MSRTLLFITASLLIAGLAVWLLWPTPTPAPKIAAPVPTIALLPPPEPSPRVMAASTPATPISINCGEPAALAAAAADNGTSLTARDWAPWGRPERGWEIYLPLVAREVGSTCPAGSPGFASALARWQSSHRLPADGVLTPAAFEVMRVAWLKRRPFVVAFSKGQCPAAADESQLAAARPDEGYSGKSVSLTPAALAAYRAMVVAARRDLTELATAPRLLTIFSAYRAPAADEARCDLEQSCGAVTRARCSAHRTGRAVDLYLGAAPGSRPESSDDANRLFQSRSAGYRWLVSNGDRFGFVNYPFEPWHWEWTGA